MIVMFQFIFINSCNIANISLAVVSLLYVNNNRVFSYYVMLQDIEKSENGRSITAKYNAELSICSHFLIVLFVQFVSQLFLQRRQLIIRCFPCSRFDRHFYIGVLLHPSSFILSKFSVYNIPQSSNIILSDERAQTINVKLVLPNLVPSG